MPIFKCFVFLLLCLTSACGIDKQAVPSPSVQSNQVPRTIAKLPAADVPGASSLGFNIYSKGQKGVTTAAGQIFLPPKGHAILIKVGFLCRHSPSSTGLDSTEFRVKLRISPWNEDRPSSTLLWESEATLITKGFDFAWFSFDVPHLELMPDQKYIAWLSMVGLTNVDDANFSIISMGARTSDQGRPRPNEPYQPNSWSYDYPEGSRAFWRQSNPQGLTDAMTQTSWIVDKSGENLHFKMVFENRRPNDS